MSDTDYINEDGSTGQTNGDEKQPLSRKAKLIIGIGAAVVIVALGLALPFLLQRSEASVLTVTVFSNDWSEVTLKPGVETALNEFLASDSSVPGFPLRVSDTDADDILLSVDAGTLLTWGKPDYVASDKGQEYAVSTGSTVYWSPVGADGSLVPQCTLTATARKNGAEAGQARLIIRQTSETGYSITLLASE